MGKRLKMGEPKGPRLEIGASLEEFTLFPERHIGFLENILSRHPVRMNRQDIRIEHSLMRGQEPHEFIVMRRGIAGA
jgi:hypothetical protein